MKRCIFIYIFIALLLSAPQVGASSGGGLFDVYTEHENSISIPVAADEEVEISVTEALEVEEVEEIEEISEATAPVVKEPEIVSVKSGDSLWAIAEKYLGDGSRYPELIEANKDKYPGLVKNPGLIHPGWKLEIPSEEEEEDSKVEPVDEKGAEDVVVQKDTGMKVEDVVKESQLSTLERLNILNSAFGMASNPETSTAHKEYGESIEGKNLDVDLLLKAGYITKEDFVNLNPPEGYKYAVRDGRVTLVDAKNKPITNSELIVMTLKDLIDNPQEPKIDEDKKLAKDDAKSKQDAYDEAMGRKPKVEKKPKAEEKPKVTEKPKAQEKPKAEEKKAPDAKKVEEVAQQAKTGADKLYSDSLSGMNMPDFRNMKRKDYRSLEGLQRLLTRKELNKYYNLMFGYTDLVNLQKTLKSSQDTYVKKVDKNDTNWFGGNIRTSGNKVEKNEANLTKAWKEYQELYKIAESVAKERQKELNANLKEIKKLEAKRDKIGYDSSRAKENQDLVKQIKKLESANKNLQKDVDAFNKVKNTFGAYK